MSVRLKILAASLGFVAIIALLGGLAQRQAAQMGRLAVGIYDHSFMGMSYVDQTQEEFLRLLASRPPGGGSLADPAGHAAVQKVLDRLDVALERASSERTRAAGQQARQALAALPEVSAADLAAKLALADRAIVKLVKKFSADGLDSRDEAEALAAHSTRLVLIQIAVAVALALGVGFVLGRNLSRPLVQLVRIIGRLAAGELDHEVAPRLLRRRDEIGEVARASSVFREAMQQNLLATDERDRLRKKNEEATVAALRSAADSIERETVNVAQRSAEGGAALAGRAESLAGSAARMLASIASVTQASATALQRSELVAASSELLSQSAHEIAGQIGNTATEIANAARAGERAREMIDQLTTAVSQIGAVARLIGDIAGRTNLLALNATIEAARAGEAGRGFAVVASEVKALAAQTARSTGEIARNAGAIQQATQAAVDVVGEMIGRVTAIERITGAVASAAEQQTAATGDIARNVADTAAAIRIVSGQMEAVSDEAHGTGDAVSEMRDLAAVVSNHISELRGVMIRIVRTSSDAANRRQDPRITVERPATLLVDGRSLAGMCVDLSLGGARMRVNEPVAAGASVILRLPGLPDLPGQVIASAEQVRISFDGGPDAAPAELRALLGELIAA